MTTAKRVRHILSLSGGKDSAALAIYLKDRIPNLEYVFCDTEKELPETYEYLDLLEVKLGQRIVRLLHDGRGFDHWLKVYRNYLPSARSRWCTRHLKLQPFEQYVGDDPVVNYIGLRADEHRDGYISTKPNIRASCPFQEDGIRKADVKRILEESGIGLPEYYKWRSRSGCYFCFFQQKIEWVGLLENHPSYYALARDYEKVSPDGSQRYTWNPNESLDELAMAPRVDAIRAEHARRTAAERQKTKRNQPLINLDFVVGDDTGGDYPFESSLGDDEFDRPCLICQL